MAKTKSSHILNTSSNLLGFCLIILTSVKVSSYDENSLIDEFTAFTSIILIIACILSFLSIRSEGDKTSYRLENTAEIMFILALLIILFVIVLITLNILK